MEMIDANTTERPYGVIFKIYTYNDDGSVYKSNEYVKLKEGEYLDLDEIKVFSLADPFQGEDIGITPVSQYFHWGGGSNYNVKMAFYGW